MENRSGPSRPNPGAPPPAERYRNPRDQYGAPPLARRYRYPSEQSVSTKLHEKGQRSVINALFRQPESSRPGNSKTPKRHQKLMDFEVAKQDYSVAEFHDTYYHNLPKLVWVSQGFCGEIVEDTFDREQVIRLETVSRQKRVVARCEVGIQTKLLSLPVAYIEKLCVITRSGKHVSKEKTLVSIIKDTTLPCLVQFPKDRSIVVSGQKISTNHIPRMELLQCFDEMYLLGNFVTDGVMAKDVINVPLYLSQLRLAEVVGIRGASKEKFASYLEGLTIAASHNEYDMEFGNAGIAEYDPNAIHSDTTYSYVEPRLYTNFMPMIQRPPMTPQETVAAMDNPAYTDEPVIQDNEYQEIGMERNEPVKLTGFMPKPSSNPNLPKDFKEDLKKKITKERPRTPPADYKQGASDPHQSKAGPPVPRKPNNPADFTVPSRAPLEAAPASRVRADHEYTNGILRGEVPPMVQTGPTGPTVNRSPQLQQHSPVSKSVREVRNAEDVAQLTIDEVCEYMKRLKLEQYAETFKTQMVDGQMLQALDRDILKDEFDMKAIETLRLLKFASEGYIPV